MIPGKAGHEIQIGPTARGGYLEIWSPLGVFDSLVRHRSEEGKLGKILDLSVEVRLIDVHAAQEIELPVFGEFMVGSQINPQGFVAVTSWIEGFPDNIVVGQGGPFIA